MIDVAEVVPRAGVAESLQPCIDRDRRYDRRRCDPERCAAPSSRICKNFVASWRVFNCLWCRNLFRNGTAIECLQDHFDGETTRLWHLWDFATIREKYWGCGDWDDERKEANRD
ncbi:MAG: hypothetical protein M0T85_01905 [Dehalococcoidales bacterium]|nr:hypothetical protein [Dehalococcoidales bacterium]